MAVLRRLGLEGEPEFGELLDFIGRGHHIVFAADTPRINVVGADPAEMR